MAEADKAPIILWLDDKREEIRDEVDELVKAGCSVITARDVMAFQDIVQELSYDGRVGSVILVVLDIMLEGVNDLSRYYRGVRDALTSNGYAAGLVFLERVLVTQHVYQPIKGAPIALNSKRAMSDSEKARIRKIQTDHGLKVHIFEKSGARAIYQHVSDLRSRTQEVKE